MFGFLYKPCKYSFTKHFYSFSKTSSVQANLEYLFFILASNWVPYLEALDGRRAFLTTESPWDEGRSLKSGLLLVNYVIKKYATIAWTSSQSSDFNCNTATKLEKRTCNQSFYYWEGSWSHHFKQDSNLLRHPVSWVKQPKPSCRLNLEHTPWWGQILTMK